jgi:serine protease inhibitor
MNFINLPSRSRRLVPVAAMKLSGDSFLMGFDETMQATIAAIPFKKEQFSLVLILPGRPSEYIAGGLSQIETKLNNETWSTMMRSLQNIQNVDIQVPTLSQR